MTSTQLNGAFITQLPGSTVSVITAGGNRVYLMDRGRLLLAFDTREQVPEGFGDFVYPIGLWPHPWKPRTFAVTYGYPSWFVGTLEYEISEDWSSYEVRIINQIAGGELNATFSTGGAVTGTYYGDYHEGSVSENCIGLSNPYSDGVQEIVSPVAVYDVLVESNTFWDYGPNARFELWRVGIDGSNPIRIGQGSNDIRYYIPSYGVSGQFLPNGIDVPGTGYILPMVTSGPSANDDSSSFYGENGITVFTVDMESNPPELHELTLPLPEETLNGLAAGGYFHKYRDGVMAIAKVGFENNVANANRTNLVFWVLKVDAGDELRLKVPGAETGTIGPDSLAEGNVHLKLKTPYGWARSLTGEEYGSDVYPLRVFTGDDNEDTEWRTAAGLTFGELPD